MMKWIKYLVGIIGTFFVFCFFQGCSRMKSINGSTSYYLKGDKIVYSQEGSSLIRGESVVEYADINSFEPLSDDYAKDKNYVFYGASIIEKADVKSITLIKERNSDNWSSTYIKDKNYVFYETQIVEGADINTFIPTGIIAKDKNHLYTGAKINYEYE